MEIIKIVVGLIVIILGAFLGNVVAKEKMWTYIIGYLAGSIVSVIILS